MSYLLWQLHNKDGNSFQRKHKNGINNDKHQTRSDLINNEAKESVFENTMENLTKEEVDKILDWYKAKMYQFDNFENSDTEI